ncbi:MAG: hypothetical protein Kow0090_01590 [Myxococcota bacterium]
MKTERIFKNLLNAKGKVDLNEFFYQNYDELIPLLSPYYYGMQNIIAHLIPQNTRKIVDLGCGTGTLLANVIKANPSVEVAIGIDKNKRFASRFYSKFPKEWQGTKQFCALDFTALTLPFADIYVATLALHNLSPEVQVRVISEILRTAPIFILFDIYKGETDADEEEKYEFTLRYMRSKNVHTAVQEIVLNEMRIKDSPLTIKQYETLFRRANFNFETLLFEPGYILYKAESEIL